MQRKANSIQTSIYKSEKNTITIIGQGKKYSYKGCNQKKGCIKISQAYHYEEGYYLWKNGLYSCEMIFIDKNTYKLILRSCTKKI